MASVVSLAQAKSLVVCTEASPEGFDLVQYTAATTFDATAETIFDRLIGFKPGTTELQPRLATSWEISDDGLSYTFHLRPDVHFHTTSYFTPTRTFNADDVIWTFKRPMDRKAPWYDSAIRGYAYFDSMAMGELIKSVEKLDAMTVRFTLTRPDAAFLADLAMGFTSIYSAEYGDQLLAAGKTGLINSQPIGTGPFVFGRYVKDAQVRFKANPAYFGGKPKIDQLIFAISTDASVRLQKLRAGECQVALLPKAEDIPKLREDSNLAVEEIDALMTNYLTINTEHPPLDDARVRKAINLAIDRKALLNAMSGGGQLTPAVNPYPSSMLGYDETAKPIQRDLEEAKRLLKEAGVNDLKIDLFMRNGSSTSVPNPGLIAQMIQADLAQANISLNIRMLEWGELLRRAKNGEHDLALLGWMSDNGDPDNFLGPNLSCAAAKSGENQARWCNQEFESLIQKAKLVTDPATRADLYKQALQVFQRELPWVALSHPRMYVVLNKKVSGYVISPLGNSNFSTVELK
ncbi:ABC transporter substrate-binding protein [Ectopseudomonas mendocina]|uniref:ABC transporter substrate-binding protein n=1 Tax=Ectopseudomonas mendocina TaxID=300 RepID=A0ABZ2RI20_ECTME